MSFFAERYLEHVSVVVMAVLHHHRLVSGQSVGDAVLALAVHRLSRNTTNIFKDAKYLLGLIIITKNYL